MNTKVWGPPTWRLMHYLSKQAEDNGARPQYNAFLRDIGHALPCKFCRDSWNTKFIVREGLPENVIERCWALHHLVTDKLDVQNWRAQGSPQPFVQPRRMPLACLMTKFRITLRNFPDEAFWSHLEIFAYGSALPGCREGKKAYIRYCRSLSALLESTKETRLAQALRSICEASETEQEWTSESALMIVFSASTQGRGTLPEFDKNYSCVQEVEAGRCASGTCDGKK